MRAMFKGFYTNNSKSDVQIYKDEDTIFIFDTNVILDLYRNNPDTINAIKTSIEKVKGRVFLPYYAALEYQRRRLGVINDQRNLIASTIAPVVEIIKHAQIQLEKCKNTKARHYEGLNDQSISLIEKSIGLMEKDLHTMCLSLHQSRDALNSEDTHRKWIDSVFHGQVGGKKEQAEINSLDAECKKRYEYKTPPGFCDISKDEKADNKFMYDGVCYKKAYGDFYIWMEALDYSKGKKAKNVFFITNDAKDDFIFKVGKDKERENKGVHAILREEMINYSGVNNFDVLTTKELIVNIKKSYQLDIDTDNLSISTGDSSVKNKNYKKILSSDLDKLNAEVKELANTFNKSDDTILRDKIKNLVNEKLSAINKIKALLSDIKE